ncbi:DNA-directed RNA polymerase, putative [Plasmodium gallinaceum]|uniref:DNA-directed RNA polymerase n=1 Tax=Plasmodium gallinaceum TaxID=5849 RepID=A0A1J1GVM3_PLAGA|nr:DNA-directed RNA polymerase, putative [Plasmodium gallinaceum]CRG96302.1 DNA-directed RNA polymerase, putative [Plasmodium gallinaceum]
MRLNIISNNFKSLIESNKHYLFTLRRGHKPIYFIKVNIFTNINLIKKKNQLTSIYKNDSEESVKRNVNNIKQNFLEKEKIEKNDSTNNIGKSHNEVNEEKTNVNIKFDENKNINIKEYDKHNNEKDENIYNDKNLDKEIIIELHNLISSIKKLDIEERNQIIMYINTLDKKYLRNIEKEIIIFFENLDLYMAANGLLICDIGGKEIFNYIDKIDIVNEKNDINSGVSDDEYCKNFNININNLFDMNFIKEKKKLIYGDNIYPIVQDKNINKIIDINNKKENDEQLKKNESVCEEIVDDNNIINIRRQMLIERSSYKKAIEEAEEFVSNLHDLNKITEIQGLCKIYLNWVNELEKKIINYKEKKQKNKKCFFPELIEEKLLAIITVKWAIQYTFNPLKKKYSNNVITQSKNFEQAYAYQSLFTHIAIKIGEEINNELNFQLLEKNNLLYNFIKKNKGNASFSHFQKYRMLNKIKEKIKKSKMMENKSICETDDNKNKIEVNDKIKMDIKNEENLFLNNNFELIQWNSVKKASIGGLLLKMLIDNAKIDVDINTAKEEYKKEYKYYLFLHKTAKNSGELLHSDCKYKKELNYQKYYEEESNSLNFIIVDKNKRSDILKTVRKECNEKNKTINVEKDKVIKDDNIYKLNNEEYRENVETNEHIRGYTNDISNINHVHNLKNLDNIDKINYSKNANEDVEEIIASDDKNKKTKKKSKENNFCKKQKEKLKNKDIILYRSKRDKNKIELPVFIHSYIWKNNNWYGVMHMRECCANYLLNNAINSHIPLNYLPMICKPKRWTDSEGGMLLLKNNFIRCNIKPLFNLNVCNLTRIKNIVSEIGNVKWKINKEILHFIEYAYFNGITIGKIPRNKNYSLPKSVDLKSNNNEEIRKYYLLKEEINRLNKCLISERPTFLQKLAVAKTLKDNEMIYFPHNIDFRGRMYPLSPHLHHMSDDICRSLIVFYDEKEIGEKGLFWLKVHLANNFGKDKLNFEKRIQWVDQNIDKIKKLSENPFDNIEFWSLADNPWQALAVSIDLSKALQCSDSSRYKSNIPIQQDGTCNGLQHYAALGRDKDGGKAVNIVPFDEPQDIYSVVLDIVINKIKNDLNKNIYASYCFKFDLLKRKVVKQTIMTICYGVTSIGAKNQVKGKIQTMIGKDLDKNTINKLSQYIANYIFESISEIFKRAMIIKKWFNNLSKVTNELNIPITWISPIGLPCEQPYRLGNRILVNTPLQTVSVISYKNSLLHKNKQRLGFPPNFVHSLDASHLMMTAEKMLIENNFSFAAVHDSYWAHACNVDIMNKFIRDSFVTLYNEPILENIYQNFKIRLGKYATKISPPPEQGELDISLVRGSLYFFS